MQKIFQSRYFAELEKAFKPNRRISKPALSLLRLIWVVGFILVWVIFPIPFIARPTSLLPAFRHLVFVDALFSALLDSLELYLKATLSSVLIAGTLVYATILQFFRPPVEFICKLRFLSMAGLNLFFIIFFGTGPLQKYVMMTWYLTVMMIKAFYDTKESIQPKYYDHASTIYRNQWMVAWVVIGRRSLVDFLIQVRANQAVGWTMLFISEAISPAGGGIGGLLTIKLHNPHIDEITVILIICIVAGLLIDFMLDRVIRVTCKHVNFV